MVNIFITRIARTHNIAFAHIGAWPANFSILSLLFIGYWVDHSLSVFIFQIIFRSFNCALRPGMTSIEFPIGANARTLPAMCSIVATRTSYHCSSAYINLNKPTLTKSKKSYTAFLFSLACSTFVFLRQRTSRTQQANSTSIDFVRMPAYGRP